MSTQIETRRKLLESELQRYVDVLVDKAQPEQVIVFGSLATGDVHEWSDIDLVVIQDSQESFFDRQCRIQDLIQPEVGTDILCYTPAEFRKLCRERRFFQEEIVNSGKVVHERQH